MSEKPYEKMSDDELAAITEDALCEHESGRARFQPQGETASRTIRTVPVSIRIPAQLLEQIKAVAASREMPYQRLMKVWLEDGLTRQAPEAIPKPVTLHLTRAQAEQLRESGTLEIHLEAS